ncbi:Serine/threonine-protein kinase PknB [Minicystis rosea]|nr:Serine/threonine-protein kinase PknB [Minicystis rosea]
MDAPARTLDYNETAGAATLLAPLSSSIPPSGDHPLAFAATVAPVESQSAVSASFFPPASSSRTTVLPRIEGDGGSIRLANESRTRYEPVKLLGAGGMGEVVLVEDQDIARPVAVKRLLPEMTEPSVLARFVDEIRIVGRLEHPNIVPIHDVGIDEQGRYFFVMKYVEGENLESIIDKLAAGDPEYLRKYTFEKRIEIFVGVLHALEYAHAHGIVHRDVKPANVMVGRYGEVLLMDWGVAKALSCPRDPVPVPDGELGAEHEKRGRVFATRVGSVVGTPAYMSPEQARGENENVDARCDLYSASALFHELVSLRHYLVGATTLEAVLLRVGTKEQTLSELSAARHPNHPKPPAELIHFAYKGLSLEPARRYQSAGEMIVALQSIVEGRIDVQCYVTFTKRMTRELSRFVDRHPRVALFAMLGVAATVIFAFAQLARMALA